MIGMHLGHKAKAALDRMNNRQRHNKVKNNGEQRTGTRTCHGCGKPSHLWRDCPNAVESENNKVKRSRAMFTVQASPTTLIAGNAGDSKAHLINVNTDFTSKQDKVDSFESSAEHPVHATTLDTAGKRMYHWCFDTGVNVHVTSIRGAFVTYGCAPPELKARFSGIAAGLNSTVDGVDTVTVRPKMHLRQKE